LARDTWFLRARHFVDSGFDGRLILLELRFQFGDFENRHHLALATCEP
jgi:hypothetical protein